MHGSIAVGRPSRKTLPRDTAGSFVPRLSNIAGGDVFRAVTYVSTAVPRITHVHVRTHGARLAPRRKYITGFPLKKGIRYSGRLESVSINNRELAARRDLLKNLRIHDEHAELKAGALFRPASRVTSLHRRRDARDLFRRRGAIEPHRRPRRIIATPCLPLRNRYLRPLFKFIAL